MIACAAPFHLLDLWPVLTALPAMLAYLAARTPPMIETLKRKLIALFLIPLLFTGCARAGAWKTTYAGAAVTKQLVEDAHQTRWVEPLEQKLGECDPDTHPEITTTSQYDRCLGVYAANPLVRAGLEAYNSAMTTLEKALLAANPETTTQADKAALAEAWSGAIQAATQLLALLPGVQEHVNKLRLLTR